MKNDPYCLLLRNLQIRILILRAKNGPALYVHETAKCEVSNKKMRDL